MIDLTTVSTPIEDVTIGDRSWKVNVLKFIEEMEASEFESMSHRSRMSLIRSAAGITELTDPQAAALHAGVRTAYAKFLFGKKD